MEIKLINVEFSYDGVQILKDLSLDLNPGNFISVIGQTGSGKTTLLNIIGGLLLPEKGHVYYNGKPNHKNFLYWTNKELRTKIRMLGQNPVLFSELNVEENIMLPSLIHCKNLEKVKQEKDKLLDLFGLKKKRFFKPTKLSGGEIQKVAFIRTILTPGEVLLLDEPLNNLDRYSMEVVKKIIKDIHISGVTIALTTHNAELVEEADYVFILKETKLFPFSSKNHRLP